MPNHVRKITFQGATKSAVDWSRLIGLSAGVIIKRLDAGWSVERTLTAPLSTRGRKRKTKQGPQMPLPALADYQRDMHAAHRRLSQSVRSFVREIERQMAELRHGLDKRLNEQDRGAVANFNETPSDRLLSSTQDIA